MDTFPAGESRKETNGSRLPNFSIIRSMRSACVWRRWRSVWKYELPFNRSRKTHTESPFTATNVVKMPGGGWTNTPFAKD